MLRFFPAERTIALKTSGPVAQRHCIVSPPAKHVFYLIRIPYLLAGMVIRNTLFTMYRTLFGCVWIAESSLLSKYFVRLLSLFSTCEVSLSRRPTCFLRPPKVFSLRMRKQVSESCSFITHEEIEPEISLDVP